MNFAKALNLVMNGNMVAREGWNKPGMAITHVKAHSNIGQHIRLLLDGPANPYRHAIYLPAQTDMLADDWHLVGEMEGDSSIIPGSFSDAIQNLLAGVMVHRTGWHGSGQFLYMVPGSTFGHDVARPPLNNIFPLGTTFQYRPHIDMRLVSSEDGKVHLVPWMCSIADLMAQDWQASGLLAQ